MSKIKLISILLFTFLFCSTSVKQAFADTYTLSGSVKNNSGIAISGATIDVLNSNTSTTVASTTSDSFGNYSVIISGAIYDIRVSPPSGSSFSSEIALSQNISSDNVINFLLTPSGTVILSGHVYDALGNPASNQHVSLTSPGSNTTLVTTRTDSSGNYSLQISSGAYDLHISGGTSNNAVAIPQGYTLVASNYSLIQSRLLNITVPAKKLSIHVQNQSGDPITNVALTTNDAFSNNGLSLGGDISNAYGDSVYSSPGPQTDTSGNATLWLLPNSSRTYTVTATPPNGDNYSVFALNNLTITNDTQQTITLQSLSILSGHVYDALGNPVSNQHVSLTSPGSNNSLVTTTTDSSGNYSLKIVSGVYDLHISGGTTNTTVAIPQGYTLISYNYSLTQNTTQDITIPAKKVSIHIQDVSGTAISNISFTTNDAYSINGLTIDRNLTNAYGDSVYSSSGPQTDTSGNAVIWLLPNSSRTYSINATPSLESNYSASTLQSITITGDTSLVISLHQPVTLSGHLYDALGNPISNQHVSLTSPGNNTSLVTSITDISGKYSIQITSGIYDLHISGGTTNTAVAIPQGYTIVAYNYLLAQNKLLDITNPAKKVIIHIQDINANPVSNIALTTSDAYSNNGISLGGDLTNAYGDSIYSSPGPQTDVSGNATLWLLPNTSRPYTITATPLTGNPYSIFTLNNINITGDQTELISLQYSHATPVTTATLSPAQNSDGTYPNPVSVSLSATAASGYTVAHTYYTIDGGTQQTYSSAFNVSGNGSHTIHYWSDDNSSVTEAQNTKTFTIAATYSLSGTVYVDANQNGFQDSGEAGYSGATVSLNGGQTATTDTNGNYTFSNLSADTYTETLTLPNGYSTTTTNPASVALSTDTTENFGIAQANSLVTAINAGGDTQGNFVSDTDSNGGTTYSSSASVDTSALSNPAPQAVYQTVRYGNFTYTIPNLTANAAYTLRLHFNELYWGTSLAGNSGGEGSRVFNVSVNGTQALSNYDIFQHAGGANKAIIEQLPATADSNGNITIQFSTVTDNAMVNGIEVYNGTLPSPTPTPTPTPITSEAINAGGTTTSNFLTDKAFTGGQPYSSTASVDTTGVTSPAPESVYQSVRYGNFTYALTNFVPNSTHTVRLHFNELYWGTTLTGNTGGEGSRVFNVSINNSQVLTNFDIYQQAGGANKALVKEFTTTADANGKITIQFTTVADNAMVNGIEIN